MAAGPSLTLPARRNHRVLSVRSKPQAAPHNHPPRVRYNEQGRMRMSTTIAEPQAQEGLHDLPKLLQSAEGFAALVEALRGGRAATIDGAWGSSAALAAAALGEHVPRTLLIVLAHPGDIDGWTED